MKNALLIYPYTKKGIFNIGDYIQSIAARQFLPSLDLYLDREELNKRIGERTNLIMNGWFMHFPNNWPPSPEINPLFVAFHINKLSENEMLTPRGINYLQEHEPIGCRDRYTVKLLNKLGVKAYFSGCLTLTLGKTYTHHEAEDGKVYFTDINSKLKPTLNFKVKCLWNLIFYASLLKKIQRQINSCGIKRKLSTVVAFYTTYNNVIDDELFLKAVYKEQEILDTFNSEEDKFKYAEKLLQEYSKAKFVVTSRIHCALPCLAMGTPVVFVTNNMLGEVHNCRLDGLKELFHTIDITEKGIKANIPGVNKLSRTSKFKNKPDYLPIANKLIETCKSFFK